MKHNNRIHGLPTTSSSIVREYNFSMGHALMYHDGKCFHIHGHNYRLEVEIKEMDYTVNSLPPSKDAKNMFKRSGMVMDFNNLDKLIDPVIEFYDHKLLMNITDPRLKKFEEEIALGSVIPFNFGEPTVEHIANAMWVSIHSLWDYDNTFLHGDFLHPLVRVTLYETDKSSATIWSP